MNLTELSMAHMMAHHDIQSWQAHDAKKPLKLVHEMACLYALVYGISQEDAMSTLEHFLEAVYWHDLSEMALDSGDKERAHLCWQYVQPSLVNHYIALAEKIGKCDSKGIGKSVAEHDVERWAVHHRRDFDAYCEHEAHMNVLLCDMSFADGLAVAQLRGKAVWLHNKTDLLENAGRLDEVQLYWCQAEEVLVEHYTLYIKIRQKSVKLS